MRVGIDSYCFHRYFGEAYDGLQTAAGQSWEVFDFLAYAASLRVQSVSLETCFLPDLSGGFIDELRGRLDDGGFDRVLAWGHPRGLDGGRDRQALEDLRRHIGYAKALGAQVLRFVGGDSSTRLLPREPQICTLVSWLGDVCHTAAEYGVYLAMENHVDFTATEMLRVIEAVRSDRLRVNLDTGNALRVFDDPVEVARTLGPFTVATHVKDIATYRGSPRGLAFWRSCPIGRGIVDIPAVVQALGETGYEGDLTVEIDLVHPDWEHLPEETIVGESVAYLRQVLSSLGPSNAGGKDLKAK
jgi:sugar phosphate isomerase/epimerase